MACTSSLKIAQPAKISKVPSAAHPAPTNPSQNPGPAQRTINLESNQTTKEKIILIMTKKEGCWHLFDVFSYCSCKFSRFVNFIAFTGRMRQLYQYGEFLDCKQYMKMFVKCGLEDVTERERFFRLQNSLDEEYGKVWRLREDFYCNSSESPMQKNVPNGDEEVRTNGIENNTNCFAT